MGGHPQHVCSRVGRGGRHWALRCRSVAVRARRQVRLCQIYSNESWHYELRPEAIDHGCPAHVRRPCTTKDAAVTTNARQRTDVNAITRRGEKLSRTLRRCPPFRPRARGDISRTLAASERPSAFRATAS